MRRYIWVGLVVALAVGALLSPWASPNPDGLEKVAETHGFIDKGISLIAAPIADYLLPGVANEKIATGLAGIIGVLITFAAVYAVGKIVAKPKG